MAQTNQKPKVGDLIEIDQPDYQHWAVYVGGGYVVHLVPADGVGPNASFSLSASTKKALVKRQRLSKVTNGNKWRINNKYDNKFDPKPIWEVAEVAIEKVGEKIDYNIVTMNCEHFVTSIRYGQQVVKGAGILGKAAAVLVAFVAFGFVIMKSLGHQ